MIEKKYPILAEQIKSTLEKKEFLRCFDCNEEKPLSHLRERIIPGGNGLKSSDYALFCKDCIRKIREEMW